MVDLAAAGGGRPEGAGKVGGLSTISQVFFFGGNRFSCFFVCLHNFSFFGFDVRGWGF